MKKIYLIIALSLFVNLTYSSVIVTNGLTHVYSGMSGTQIQGEIILLNNSDEEQTVFFSLNEAIFSCAENRTFSATQSHLKSSLKWFDGSLMDKVLSPKEKYTYKFTINIPKDQAIRGTFWNMLMIDIAKPIKKEKLAQNIGLNTKMRYAIALITNVNSLDEVSLDFQKIEIDKTTGNKNLTIKIANQHSFIEGVKLSLEVYDAEGKNIFQKTTIRGLVFPGFCKDYTIDISELPKGNYECLLVADSREKFVGTNVSLTID
ncbi:hypothetical protein [Flavobacterium frigoris]|uniref:DUF3324 domain-containing protein n=1 Tax=Flavobacterium frigoris (strain PS1) TaxID=1086011 RepID=H7FP20_FLAFP|nr:hypothetical protein [Flavobacterium frigoris]EIA09702.1 hypothetical protein HJ01_00918 [Flavobacterium frigoris PS1]